MYIIDTNILVSEILVKYEQDELTNRCREFFQEMPLIKRVVPDFILNEFELLMIQVVPSRYKNQINEQGKKDLMEITTLYMERVIEKCVLVAPTKSVIKVAFEYYKQLKDDHYISFTDSLLLATAKHNGYTIFTKDKRINLLAKQLDISFIDITKEKTS